MATWGDQTCQRFEATAVGFETGFSRLRVPQSNRSQLSRPTSHVHVAELPLLTTKIRRVGDCWEWPEVARDVV